MEEAVVGAVVGATIQVVLQNLISVSLKEIKLVQGFNKDLEKLRGTLVMMQNILYHAEMQQVTDRAVKQWLKKLEDVAFEADNVLDEFNYELLRKERNNMETQTTMKKRLVKSIFSRSNFRDHRLKLGHKIRDINKELELINQEANSFGLQMRLASGHASGGGSDAPASLETDSFTADPIFLGRDNDVLRIVEILTTSSTDQVFSILPIVGMGGLGKTTLAREVYHIEKIRTHFQNHIWVHVSTNFDPMIVFKNILTSLTSENVENGSREVLLKKLQQALGAKTYLLVLDDVWNQDRHKWDGFINSLSRISSTKGNGIIVTTRNTEVASIVETLPIYELKGLSEGDCWSIIRAKAFRGGNILSGFETMGRNIAKRCQGLPLAANVVGGVLCGKSKDEWRSIQENWLSDHEGGENIISKILKLSFDNLSSPSLKKCFAYCSIFPKGFEIERERLIELWMAEGFLQTDQRNDMESVGNKFFNLLVQNSLLQVGYGNVKHCNMHNLVHDVACSVLGSKLTDNNLGQTSRVRYIWCESIESISKEQAKFLRTLIFREGEVSDVFTSNGFPKEQAKCLRPLFREGVVSDTTFSEFNSLHVLSLIGDDVKQLPSSISKLIHLRYLDISYTRIECLPDSIGELYHLQTLRAVKEWWEKSYLRELPNTLKYLINLRHLHIPNIELPPEIGRLMSLQTLPYFRVGDEEGRGIVELGRLKNLRGKLEIHNLEKVHDKNEAKSADLFEKSDIFELKLVWSQSREGEINDENVLEVLQPHQDLKKLYIDGFKGRSFPLWTLKMAVRDDLEGCWIGLNDLMEITLSRCGECKEIPMLGHLPHLKSLCLRELNNVTSIGSLFYGVDNCSASSSVRNGVCKETILVFPALEIFVLSNMSKLTEWVEVELPSASETQLREVVVFPCLKYLEVNGCRQLMSAPSHFPCLEELMISRIRSGSPLSNISGIKLTTLTKLTIGGLDGLECLPDGFFNDNQNLSKLSIINCPNLTHLVPCLGGGRDSLKELVISNCSKLRELPDDLHDLNFLEELSIKDCPNLKSIPYSSGGQSQGFTSLCRLYIWGCEGLINLPTEMIESCALSLESLSLKGLTSLMNLPVVIGCLQKLPRLKSLCIDNIPKFISNSALEIGSLRSLQHLFIGPPSDSSDCISFKATLDDILQGSQSLRQLFLHGMDHWDSLPDQLQHLTTLTYLEINKFAIEALPEWFGNLSSLERLDLSFCENLWRFPSKEAMLRLNKLTHLFIRGCSSLQERCIEQQSDDSEWHKISHICNIYGLKRPSSPHRNYIWTLAHTMYENHIDGRQLAKLIFIGFCFLQGIFQGSQSLRRVDLLGMKHWDSLPNQLQHPTALSD